MFHYRHVLPTSFLYLRSFSVLWFFSIFCLHPSPCPPKKTSKPYPFQSKRPQSSPTTELWGGLCIGSRQAQWGRAEVHALALSGRLRCGAGGPFFKNRSGLDEVAAYWVGWGRFGVGSFFLKGGWGWRIFFGGVCSSIKALGEIGLHS